MVVTLQHGVVEASSLTLSWGWDVELRELLACAVLLVSRCQQVPVISLMDSQHNHAYRHPPSLSSPPFGLLPPFYCRWEGKLLMDSDWLSPILYYRRK